ncbi:hypothetical protein [Xylanimonas protaetiae]|uniref:Uncharacterized protein n=1 Tax=Xylanimonas protaetiae TaxID=2509457 RepID=A0A4P6F293_9MICO|nr:hypothetical protein [Xylanimonas protaetiae]QAY68833.1 hypothetical protein ET471_01205 [Xylanimonas protaetiae]
MTAHDDALVATLSRLAAAAPTIDVDTSRVVSTGRRRRDRRRSVATASLGLVVLAGVGFSQASAWTADPVVSAHEPLRLDDSGRVADAPARSGVPEQSVAPAIAPLGVDVATPEPAAPEPATTDAATDAVVDAGAAGDPAGLPAALAVGLGAAGVGALGAGAFFALRSRRHAA